MPSFSSQTQALESFYHKTFLSETTGAVRKKPRFPPFLHQASPIRHHHLLHMFPLPEIPRPIPIALGTNSHDCAKGYVLFAERIGLLELLRPLPTKPATGKYPGCVWVVLAQLISSGKKNGQPHSLRTGKFSMLAHPFFG